MLLSIIVPVFNEEKTIEKIIDKLKSLDLPVDKEIIVVDDASTDGTWESISKMNGIMAFRQKQNGGKGSAVRTGISKTKGEIIIIQDADLEYNPDDIPSVIQPILNGITKVVYGSRFKGNIIGERIFHHDFGNKILSWSTNIIYGTNLSDMETGYKAFKKEVLDGVKLKAKRFDLEPEITAKIIKKGYKILEVPISFRPRKFDEGKKISWRDGIKALYYLLKYRFSD